jgi:zinc/manganese transport system substrate-binding protein
VAEVLAQRLAQLDPPNAAAYRAQSVAFSARWRQAIERWEQAGAKLKDVPVVVYHRDFSYFIRWIGMREAGSLEPKPGIPPTPAHLAGLVEQMKRAPARVLSERTGIPAVMLPFTVGGTEKAGDLFALFEETIRLLLEAAK